MSSTSHRTFTFGEYTLDAARGALLHGEREVKLRPKSFEVLRLMLERHGRLISKEELLHEIWGRSVVTDGALTQCLIDVRRALGDDSQSIIRTVPRRGYIFQAPVVIADVDAINAPRASPDSRFRRFGWRSAAAAVVAVFGCVGAGAFWLFGSAESAQRRGSADLSDAEESYQQGVFFYDRRAEGDLARAHRYLDEALRRDPTHARAWSALAGVYGAQLVEADAPCELTVRKRSDAIARALALDPTLAEAHVRAAQHYWKIGDIERSDIHHRQAVALAPDSPLVLVHSSTVAAGRGSLNKAIDLTYRAIAADPIAATLRGHLIHLLMLTGRYDEALAQARKQAELSPELDENADPLVAQIYILQRRFDGALAIVQRLPEGPDRQQGLAMIYREIGRDAAAAAQIDALAGGADIGSAVRLGEIYAYRGESDESVRWLRTALALIESGAELGQQREWIVRLQHSPFLRTLQADVRWRTLIGEWRSRVMSHAVRNGPCGSATTLASAHG